MTDFTFNIVVVVAEVLIIFTFFFLLNWFFEKMYREFFKLPILSKFSKNLNLSTFRRKFRNSILFLNFILSLVIISINGYLIYRGENVRETSLHLLKRVPKEIWLALGLGIVKSIAAIIGVGILLRIFNPLIDRLSKYAQDFDEIAENDESVAVFFAALKTNINSASWIAISILCAQFLILPPFVSKYLYILLKIYLIISFGLLLFKIVAVIIDSLDALSIKYSSPNKLLRFYAQLRHLLPFLKRCLEFIAYVFMATLCVQQVDFIANLAIWGASGIKVISILLISRILISVAYLLLEEFLLNVDGLTEIQQQKRKTITPLIQSSSKYLIYFGSFILILDSIGVDPGPILAGAGILGLAVGLGAQNLINDIVSGFLILFENYYLVGDYIETDAASGYVEAIELRTTRIRDYLGQVYIIRNGDIASITNFSKGFIYADVEIGVDYGTNLEFVESIVDQVGNQLLDECEDILEPTQVEGIEEFGEIRLSIYTVTKVKPGRHLQIKRILRQVLKEAFDREGIFIPVGEMADKPDWVSRTQQEQSRRYKNSQPNIKKIIKNHYLPSQELRTRENQYQLNGHSTPHEELGPQQQPNSNSDTYQYHQEIATEKEKVVNSTNDNFEINTNLDRSIEETAKLIEDNTQKNIINQVNKNLILDKSLTENQNYEQVNQAIIHRPDKDLSIYESDLNNQTSQEGNKLFEASEKPRKKVFLGSVMQRANTLSSKAKSSHKSRSRIAKELKDNLKKFLENN